MTGRGWSHNFGQIALGLSGLVALSVCGIEQTSGVGEGASKGRDRANGLICFLLFDCNYNIWPARKQRERRRKHFRLSHELISAISLRLGKH